MAELQIRDLHVYLGNSYVVQGATLTVDEGQAVAVLGRNGVGKTTLLRSIMGLTDPVRQGSLRWDGVELTLQPAWSRNAAGIAYVPQGRRIFPSLSVEENLLVARRPARAGVEPWTIDQLYTLFPNLRDRRDRRGTCAIRWRAADAGTSARTDRQSTSDPARRADRGSGAYCGAAHP